MPEANNCDLLCPRKAFLAAEYRQETQDTNPLAKLVSATTLGIHGVAQAIRTSHCPQRTAASEGWQPSSTCIAAVREAHAEHPLDTATLTPYEDITLRPYLLSPDTSQDTEQ